jgi:non-heme chloroperoxidase
MVSPLRFAVVAFFLAASPAFAQQAPAWHDPSPHSVQFVNVEKDVKLEVLDWGGNGRPVVLLAGLGNTAHVFDDFAPKLTSEYHLYGITRRGFGASSAPVADNTNYSADRLGDDVVAVIDALKLEKPVLVGHSRAGEELSSVGSQHPEKVEGLIYLDAAYAYAFYDPSLGDLRIDLYALESKLDRLKPGNGQTDPRFVQELVDKDLPQFEKDLRGLEEDLATIPQAPPPTAADRASASAYASRIERTEGIRIPEAEIRQMFNLAPDGSVGRARNPSAGTALVAGTEKFTKIGVPILAIYAIPHDLSFYDDPSVRSATEARDAATTEAIAKAFERGVPSARVVRLPHANHFVFLSNEADVMREMRVFFKSLG